jgi:2-dehydropantoate 2-reductase
MNVTVLGAGAMGCLFGGRLSAAGVDVLLVDVWQAHVEKINRSGLIIEKDQVTQTIRVPAATPDAVDGTPDLVLMFTKSYHTQSALSAIAGVLDEETRILTLQNGVGHVDVIQTFIHRSRIIHGVTTYPCDMVGPAYVRTQGDGDIRMMSVDKTHSERLVAIADLFSRAGFNCRIQPDVETAIWEKLAFNAALNALTAVLRLPVGAIGNAHEGRALAYQIIDEVVSVARKQNIGVDRQRIGATVEMALTNHRDHQPSMLQDVLKQRRTEIDVINGAAIQAARQFAMTLPANETVYRLIKIVEGTLET